MYITQFREQSVGDATLSKVFCGEAYICDVLEDVVREVPGQPVSMWKVHGQTAIPAGIYRVAAQYSQRFGPDTLTLLDVPGFEYIRIHGGNTPANTEGCLLPGTRTSQNSVASSQASLRSLKALIMPALQQNQRVLWEIIPTPMEA